MIFESYRPGNLICDLDFRGYAALRLRTKSLERSRSYKKWIKDEEELSESMLGDNFPCYKKMLDDNWNECIRYQERGESYERRLHIVARIGSRIIKHSFPFPF